MTLRVLLLCMLAVCAGCRQEATPPNIILVSLDTLRAQSLGLYGYSRDTSPFLDALAAEGFVFETAITPSATTGPAHMSMFTGLYPREHGVVLGIEKRRADVPTLAQRLAAAGYRTAAFTENGFLIRANGFEDGFQEYVEHLDPAGTVASGKAQETFGAAIRWLEARPDEPFFLFVHTYQVHAPYRPPEAYRDLFSEEPGDGTLANAPDWARAARDRYDAEIRYVDDQVARLVEAVRREDLAGSTVIVLTSDHGESFMEHGASEHGTQVHHHVLRVPLVFWGPGRIEAGGRSTRPVSLIDLAPTLLDLAGAGAHDMTGVSHAPVLRGDASPPERLLFAEATSPIRWQGSEWLPARTPRIAVRSGDRKYVFHRPTEGEVDPPRVYDLGRDPSERDPMGHAPELEVVEHLVDAYLAAGGSSSEPGLDRLRRFGEQIPPDLREQLSALGYLVE